MPTYKKTNITSKTGVNFIRSAVEGAGSLFHKIEMENDLGIDALIELIRDEKPLNKQIAIQIKSGQSYYNSEKEEVLIPIMQHRNYWSKHPLPVIGIVYIPTLKRAHWVDIKPYLKSNPDSTTIRYKASEANRFDQNSFSKMFIPKLLNEVPELTLTKGLELFRSAKPDEFYLGLIVLFRRYPNNHKTWDEFIKYFINNKRQDIPYMMIYYFAHIPWHGDIASIGEIPSKETREYVNNLFANFKKEHIIKLLCFIDEESFISRGSLGQSVEALISSLPHSINILKEIITNNDEDIFIQECAALILAMNEGKNSLPIISKLAETGSWYAQEIIKQVKDYGGINPY